MGFSWGGLLGDLGSVFSSGGTIAADALTQGAYSNAQAQKDVNQASMAFNERMSNTAYQRAMADMKTAGLNPMLAYSQGGASTPGANLTAPEPGKIGAGLVNTAKDALTTTTQVENTKADTENKKTQAPLNESLDKKAQSETRVNNQKVTHVFADTQIKNHAAKTEYHRSREASARATQAEMDLQIQKGRQSLDKKMAVPDAILERAENAASAVTSGRRVFQRDRSSSPPNPDTNYRSPYYPRTAPGTGSRR